MCFAAARFAVRPDQTFAYKIVRTSPSNGLSYRGFPRRIRWPSVSMGAEIFRSRTQDNHSWPAGAWVERSPGRTLEAGRIWSARSDRYGFRTVNGIYVYPRVPCTSIGQDTVLVKVDINPEDFLHLSDCREMATYHRARIASVVARGPADIGE